MTNTLDRFNNIVKISSLEIAKITGKEHFNVLRDIRKVLNELELDALKFEGVVSTTRPDGSTIKITVFNLPKREALI